MIVKKYREDLPSIKRKESQMKRSMLTTIDNPHSPFDNFEAWYSFDVSSGYHSSDFLARIVLDSDELSESDLNLAIELAIDEVIKENVSGVYRKVTKEFPDQYKQ